MGINAVSSCFHVIVRADRDELVKLRAVGADIGGVIVVEGRQRNKTIGFPADLVFEMDDALFATLRDAFERHDARALASAWSAARRFDENLLLRRA